MASKSNHRRVRYDRILAVLLVLILLIVLLVKCCSSCSSNKNKKNNGTVTTTPTQETTTAPTESDYSKTVYLSPSNQEDNAFMWAIPTRLLSAAFWRRKPQRFWNSPA